MVTIKGLKSFIPLILTSLLALILFFLVRDFLRTVIITPMLYVSWFITLIAGSISQGMVWVVFILFMVIIAFNSLKKRAPEHTTISQIRLKKTGQVEKWTRLLDHAQKDHFTKWRLANELKHLTQKIFSSPNDGNEMENPDDLELPTQICAFFEAQMPQKNSLWNRLTTNSNDETQTALDLDPEIVIQYLEKRSKS
jgi:hypothetical protein